ncbi:MAG: response regulator [Dehalococcoidales bacterium]
MTKIMIVDDSAFTRAKCSRLLGERGYEVVEASNGLEALEKYQQYRPDAVLLDIAMPLMDGIVALREIRKIDPAARVVMVTAMGQRAIVLSAVKEGAKGFVVKPFRDGKVVDTIQRLISSVDLTIY